MNEIRSMPRIKKSSNPEAQKLMDERERLYAKGDLEGTKKLTKKINAVRALELNAKKYEKRRNPLYRIF